MSIFSAFRLTAFLIFLLFSLIGFSVYKINVEYIHEQEANKIQRELARLGRELARGSDYLTNEIRRYVQFGDRIHYDNFWKEVHETRSRDKAVEKLIDLKVLPQELAYIEKAKAYSDNLIKTEEAAMKAVENNRFEEARKLVFGKYYDQQKKLIMGNIRNFQKIVNERAWKNSAQARQKVWLVILLTNVLLVISGLVIFLGLYAIGIRKLLNPVKKLTDTMLKLAKDEAQVKIPEAKYNDEIADMLAALKIFKENAIERKQGEIELAKASAMSLALEESNANLEEFASIVSHDLQEPLRKVPNI